MIFDLICFALTVFFSSLVLGLNTAAYFVGLIFKGGKSKVVPANNVVVITGCDSGFGEMTAIKLSKMGFHVVAACLTTEGVAKMKNVAALTVQCDITKEKDVEELTAATTKYIESKGLRLWGLVNNAGIAVGRCLDWMTMDLYRKVMDVNFFGHVHVTKCFLPLLKHSKNSRIVNLSSMAGLNGMGGLSAYCASKFAMEAFMKSLRDEMRAWNIHVSNINPGFMKTPIATGSFEKNIKDFATLPEEIREQYVDPLPIFKKSEEFINMTMEDPVLVVDKIVCALTEARPDMWYFPGWSAAIGRTFPMITSDAATFFWSMGATGLQHKPTPETLRKFQGNQ